MVDHDHRQRAARRQARFPVQRQIFQLPLEPASSVVTTFSSRLLASARREKSGASCGICRGNSHTGSSIASCTAFGQTP
jgi:hypothetical protein